MEEREEMEEQVFHDGGWTVSDAIDNASSFHKFMVRNGGQKL